MKDNRFESQEERREFLRKAHQEGVFLTLETSGIPCGVEEPEPCLGIATVVTAYYTKDGWYLVTPMCSKCASSVARFYERKEE